MPTFNYKAFNASGAAVSGVPGWSVSVDREI